MHRRPSIADLLRSGVSLQTPEAVAIVQQLIFSRPADVPPRPPFGPPTIENVFVGADGAVTCVACAATCAVSEMAALLQAMLPPARPGVPGSLRYAIARALLEVDAPPFDSLDEFSRALARHERGDRMAAVRDLFARIGPALSDRRRLDPAVSQLRRELREADARLYDQQLALDALGAMLTHAGRAPRRLAVAAIVAAAAVTIGAASIELRDRIDTPVSTRPLPSPSAAAVPETAVPVSRPAPMAGSSDRVHTSARTAAPAVAEKPAVRRAAPAANPTRDRTAPHRSRFHWLRTRFVFRSDPL
jgi:hypothetical protein